MLYYVDFKDFMTKCEFSFVHFISIREFKRTFLFKKSYKQSSLKMIDDCLLSSESKGGECIFSSHVTYIVYV